MAARFPAALAALFLLGCDVLSPMVLNEDGDESGGGGPGAPDRSKGSGDGVDRGSTGSTSGACVSDPAVTSQGQEYVVGVADECWNAASFTGADLDTRLLIFRECLHDETGTGTSCTSCFAGLYTCQWNSCGGDCTWDAFQCQSCLTEHCLPSFESCSGFDFPGGGGF